MNTVQRTVLGEQNIMEPRVSGKILDLSICLYVSVCLCVSVSGHVLG